MSVLVIGIAGGSGSGKSTLTKNIKAKFGDDVSVLMYDDYYLQHDELSLDERKLLNYDSPDAYDTSLLVSHLSTLKNNQPVSVPIYDYKIYNRSNETKLVQPTSVIILEGILALADPRLCNTYDIKIFVDTDADVRVLRRVKRDINKRARTFESVYNQYLTTVKPMHELFVEPSKKNADLIILDGGKNNVALDIIYSKISNHIAGNK